MNKMNNRKDNLKKQKRTRNLICAAFCAILLLIIVTVINLLTGVFSKFFPASEKLQDLVDNLKPQTTDTESITPAETENDTESKYLFTVCLDAGHGGKDIGCDNGSRNEKDDTLKMTLAVGEYLTSQNINVVYTRSDDTFLKLSKRCEVANNAKASYFVSIHRNKGDGSGIETWIYSDADEETTALANNILSGLESVGIQRNRGVKKGTQQSESTDYYLNSHSSMPSCIIEMGFINDDTDNQQYDDNKDAYAKAIGDAIISTYNTYQAGKTNSDSEKADEALNSTEADTSTASGTSHTISNTPVDNVAALDNTTQDWGPGSNVDDQNRPVSAISYQDKYGKYNANFIAEGDHKIYLTFDEGYEYGCTPGILDTLKEKNVKAVFFVTKPYAKDEPELVQRIIDEGHMLGNHSVTHPANGLPSQSIEQQQNEVMENHQYIKDTFGYDMHLFRYPAGKFSDQSLAIVNNCNYKSVFWSFAYLDYDVNNQPDQTEALNKLVSNLHSGAIYLLHAESTTNTAILGSFIDHARAAGYEFELFD